MTQLAKFQKAENEDYESRGDSGENYDPEDFRDKLKAEEMPKRDGGIRNSQHRSTGVGRWKSKRFDTSWSMPRLDERERQAYGQKHAPIHQNYAGLLDLENA
jgi:hypothetical protein